MPTSDQRSSSSAMRELATVLSREADALSPGAFAHIVSRHPGLAASEQARQVALAAVRADIAAFAEVLGHDVPPEQWDAPLMALVHTRRLARADVGLDDILRIYRLGQEWLFSRLCEVARELVDDPAGASDLIERAGSLLFRLVDLVCVKVAAEYESERETLVRRTLVRREAVIQSILAGDSVDAGASERALGYRFDRFHIGVLSWTADRSNGDSGNVAAQDAAKALAACLGVERPLIVADGSGCVGAWLASGEPLRLDRAKLIEAVRSVGPCVRVALGTPRHGLEGFVDSRREADRARGVAVGSSRDPLCTLFEDIALVGLLATDRDGAKRFVIEQLGDLAGDDPSDETLRRTVLEVFQAGGSHKVAAHALHVHRNTVGHRLARAEAILGRPLEERRRELEAALLLSHWLGDRVLNGSASGAATSPVRAS